MQEKEFIDLMTKVVEYTRTLPPQQLFKGAFVHKGFHYSLDENYLWANYDNVQVQISRVNNDEHILVQNMFLNRTGEDEIKDLKGILLRKYKQDKERYLSNIANLTFSEN